MPDYGQPSSYLTLSDGTPVYSSDAAEIGTVIHVLAVPDDDIFDGIVIKASGGHRFVDASLVQEIFERGVALTISQTDCDRLPEPSDNPAAMTANPDDMTPESLHDKLHRAWALISGND
jgi:hypothetical protein